MAAASLAGIAVRAVNEGRHDEHLWHEVNREIYERWLDGTSRRHGLEEHPALYVADLLHEYHALGLATGFLLFSTGASLPLIGGVLGHRNHATTASYSHLAVDPVRAALDRAVAAIQEARNAPPAKVVRCRRQRARR